jgi:uncharacterized spore protein YtfJ
MEMQYRLQHLQSIVQSIGAKSVFGEPVVCGDKTIVPVASVAFGFGSGFGKGGHGTQEGEGGGGGLGFRGVPAGYIEITPAGTRFVPVREKQKMAVAMFAGIVAGLVTARLRRLR